MGGERRRREPPVPHRQDQRMRAWIKIGRQAATGRGQGRPGRREERRTLKVTEGISRPLSIIRHKEVKIEGIGGREARPEAALHLHRHGGRWLGPGIVDGPCCSRLRTQGQSRGIVDVEIDDHLAENCVATGATRRWGGRRFPYRRWSRWARLFAAANPGPVARNRRCALLFAPANPGPVAQPPLRLGNRRPPGRRSPTV